MFGIKTVSPMKYQLLKKSNSIVSNLSDSKVCEMILHEDIAAARLFQWQKGYFLPIAKSDNSEIVTTMLGVSLAHDPFKHCFCS